MNGNLINIAEKLPYRVKMNDDTSPLIRLLEEADIDELFQIKDDRHKKAFWINIYNACYQLLEQRNIAGDKIFRKRYIAIAGSFLRSQFL